MPIGVVRFVLAMSSAICQERHRLLKMYRESAVAYADAVRNMSDVIGAGLDSEIHVARRVCRNAWNDAEQARVMLLRHEADHCCDRYAASASGVS
jgi:hypothetical protein